MAAICLAWDWNIPPDIDINQSSPMRIDSPESQIPDIQIGKAIPKEMNRLIAGLQTEEDVILQRKREDKINKSNNSLTNYQAIQTILRTEIQTKTDRDIQATILQQLELLEAILEYKYLGIKEKLNAKLQKQTQETVPVQIQTQEQQQLKTYA